ncbi:MAG: DUF808 family protein, partial [Sphingomonadales bacterium]
MPGGLVALLDDVAALAKMAAASVDDVAAAAGRASTKAAGVVIDDTAVTPRYVVGLSPSRELPIIWKIALGSLRNKLLFILPAALALSAFAPWALTPLLMIGGSYLCFEAVEKIVEALSGVHHEQEVLAIDDPAELEARQVGGAIRTDFILSAEIMAIALAEVEADIVHLHDHRDDAVHAGRDRHGDEREDRGAHREREIGGQIRQRDRHDLGRKDEIG